MINAVLKCDNPLVSIILPTYNVAQYLPMCLESLLQQTYKRIEVIVVIDGSTDGSLLVAKSFAERDARVMVISQQNEGSGPARNNGVKHATGDFIAFVDPDDWVQPDYVETLVRLQRENDVDLVLVGCEEYLYSDDELKTTSIHTFSEFKKFLSKEDVICHYNHLRFVEQLNNAPWGKLYKLSILQENGIEFPELRRSQDIYFNNQYYQFIDSLVESPYAGYCYRRVIGQIGKTPRDYYKISEVLFNQYMSIVGNWRIKPDDMIYTTCMLHILSNYESLIQSGDDLREISRSVFVRDITSKASLSNPYHRLMRFFIKYNLTSPLKHLVWLKYKYLN